MHNFAYHTQHNCDGIVSIALGEAHNDFEDLESKGISFDGQWIKERAYQQVKDLHDWHEREIFPQKGLHLTNDIRTFTEVYVRVYQIRLLALQKSKEKALVDRTHGR